MSTISFTFHESFPPQVIYLCEILKLARDRFTGTKEEISDITGIPTGATSGKVVPHIKYLNYMGLIEYELVGERRIFLKTTKLGDIVFECDPYIMERTTKLLLHYNITNPTKGAPQWGYLFRQYNYNLDEPIVYKDIENNGLSKFGKNIGLGPLKSMYTSDDFSQLDIVDVDKTLITIKSKNIATEAINVYAYTLLKDWEEVYGNESEITIDKLQLELLWDRGLGFRYDEMLEALDELSSIGYIKLNKHMNPITIIKNSTSDEVLPLLYEGLF